MLCVVCCVLHTKPCWYSQYRLTYRTFESSAWHRLLLVLLYVIQDNDVLKLYACCALYHGISLAQYVICTMYYVACSMQQQEFRMHSARLQQPCCNHDVDDVDDVCWRQLTLIGTYGDNFFKYSFSFIVVAFYFVLVF